MKKIRNRKNAAAVACVAMRICAAGAVPDSMLSVSRPVQAVEAAEQTSLPQVTGLTSKTPDISSIRLSSVSYTHLGELRDKPLEQVTSIEQTTLDKYHCGSGCDRL